VVHFAVYAVPVAEAVNAVAVSEPVYGVLVPVRQGRSGALPAPVHAPRAMVPPVEAIMYVPGIVYGIVSWIVEEENSTLYELVAVHGPHPMRFTDEGFVRR